MNGGQRLGQIIRRITVGGEKVVQGAQRRAGSLALDIDDLFIAINGVATGDLLVLAFLDDSYFGAMVE